MTNVAADLRPRCHRQELHVVGRPDDPKRKHPERRGAEAALDRALERDRNRPRDRARDRAPALRKRQSIVLVEADLVP